MPSELIDKEHPVAVTESMDSTLDAVPDLAEDGPKFRKEIQDLEKKTANLKHCIKEILKFSEGLAEIGNQAKNMSAQFSTAIGTLKDQRQNASEGCDIVQFFEGQINEKFEEHLCDIDRLIVQPLRTILGKMHDFGLHRARSEGVVQMLSKKLIRRRKPSIQRVR